MNTGCDKCKWFKQYTTFGECRNQKNADHSGAIDYIPDYRKLNNNRQCKNYEQKPLAWWRTII
jgi:hypothetical protein